jgi:hypothetical protein
MLLLNSFVVGEGKKTLVVPLLGQVFFFFYDTFVSRENTLGFIKNFKEPSPNGEGRVRLL